MILAIERPVSADTANGGFRGTVSVVECGHPMNASMIARTASVAPKDMGGGGEIVGKPTIDEGVTELDEVVARRVMSATMTVAGISDLPASIRLGGPWNFQITPKLQIGIQKQGNPVMRNWIYASVAAVALGGLSAGSAGAWPSGGLAAVPMVNDVQQAQFIYDDQNTAGTTTAGTARLLLVRIFLASRLRLGRRLRMARLAWRNEVALFIATAEVDEAVLCIAMAVAEVVTLLWRRRRSQLQRGRGRTQLQWGWGWRRP